MTVLMVFNCEPYDGTDVVWNGLRLADKLIDTGQAVRIFLMNDAVDLARDACHPPETYDQDLVAMLKELIGRGVSVKVCGTCMVRCGVYRREPYYEGAVTAVMPELAEWIVDSERVLTF
jgi:uncharacterized protein involved in oxidation of intracellular sulfur